MTEARDTDLESSAVGDEQLVILWSSHPELRRLSPHLDSWHGFTAMAGRTECQTQSGCSVSGGTSTSIAPDSNTPGKTQIHTSSSFQLHALDQAFGLQCLFE
ncbi:hypothetical protein RRG08_052554 [Elysia crispata]|uniref:Uncharacterized protein n=1 Tax=Elysia crispata TaxID=231223 RepID=A0AAE0Z5E8_9GAST|nr:hypothetical protein RRG08_052554 [Elysia crispata]